MADWTCDVPLPFRMPVSVVDPVPPLATATTPVTLLAVPPILSVEVERVVSAPVPPGERMMPYDKVAAPVPPPPTPSVPETEGVRRRSLTLGTVKVFPKVSPLKDWVEGENVMVEPVVVEYPLPSAVTPLPLVESVDASKVRPLPTRSDLTAAVPLPTRMPPSVVEAVPPFGTVSAVPKESAPRLAVCEKRLVLDAVVEKRAVVVAFASVVFPVAERMFRYVVPETVSAVEEAYVAAKLVAQPVVIVPSVDEEFAKFCSPVHVLLFARSVEEAAVMVNVPPAVMGVVLMVARVPVK